MLRSAAELARFLERDCPTDLSLRAEVESLLAALLAGGYYLWSQHRDKTLISTIAHGPISVVLTQVEFKTLADAPARALDRRVDAELRRIDGELNGGPTGDRLKDLAAEVKLLRHLPPTAHARKLDETGKRIDGARDEALFSAIKTDQRTGKSKLLLEAIGEYKREFPEGNHHEEVESLYQQTLGESTDEARARVRAIPITNCASLASKANEIRQYLTSHGDDPQAAGMKQAATLAEGLAASNKLRLLIKGCGFSESKGTRYHQVRCSVNKLKRVQCNSASESASSTFDKVAVDVENADWNRVRTELWDLNWIDEEMAYSDLDILRDLAEFDGKSHFMLTDRGGYWTGAEAYLIIEI